LVEKHFKLVTLLQNKLPVKYKHIEETGRKLNEMAQLGWFGYKNYVPKVPMLRIFFDKNRILSFLF
jgi:hypothetical protein